jgi:hypothetical protein
MANQLASENARDSGDANPRAVIGGNQPPKVHELLASELAETYRLELAKVEPIAKRANDAPEKIETDEQLKAWTAIYLDADALWKSLDASRLNEQRPLLAVLKALFGPTLDRLVRITDHSRKLANDYNREKIKREAAEQAAKEARERAAADQARRDAQIAAEFGDTEAVIEHAQTAASSEAEAARISAEAPKIADVARVRADEGTGMSTAKGEWKFEILDYSKIDLNALRPYLVTKDVEKAIGKAVRALKEHAKFEGVRVYEDVATTFRR